MIVDLSPLAGEVFFDLLRQQRNELAVQTNGTVMNCLMFYAIRHWLTLVIISSISSWNQPSVDWSCCSCLLLSSIFISSLKSTGRRFSAGFRTQRHLQAHLRHWRRSRRISNFELTICKFCNLSICSLGNVSNKLSPRYRARKWPKQGEREMQGELLFDWFTYWAGRNRCLNNLPSIHCPSDRESPAISMNQTTTAKQWDDCDPTWECVVERVKQWSWVAPKMIGVSEKSFVWRRRHTSRWLLVKFSVCKWVKLEIWEDSSRGNTVIFVTDRLWLTDQFVVG